MNNKFTYDNYHWDPEEESLAGFIESVEMVGNRIAFMFKEEDGMYHVIFETQSD